MIDKNLLDNEIYLILLLIYLVRFCNHWVVLRLVRLSNQRRDGIYSAVQVQSSLDFERRQREGFLWDAFSGLLNLNSFVYVMENLMCFVVMQVKILELFDLKKLGRQNTKYL